MSALILRTIKIQNLATFKNQTIQFNKGFNTIIGETGSGKSLILDALQMCFGARADKKLVRRDAGFTSIEVTFTTDSKNVMKYFDDIGYPCEEEIIIKRIIYSNGKSKSFLNLNQCSLNVLTNTARRFIDLVGQFENQKLLSSEYQMQLLDSYAKNDKVLREYHQSYATLKDLRVKHLELSEQRQSAIERKDFLEFQIKELEALSPCADEEATLKKEKEKIVNFEKTQTTLNRVQYLLSDSEKSVSSLLSIIIKDLSDLSFEADKAEIIQDQVSDLAFSISSALDEEFMEDNLEEIIDRLDQYQKLKRKYNTDSAGLIETLARYQSEFEKLEIIDDEIDNITHEISKQSLICHDIAMKIHDKRVSSATKLSKQLTTLIRALKMNGAIVDLQVSKLESFDAHGISKINFMAQTNIGEGFYPIKDIASGGELSRILLALRQVLSRSESISVFLFDEIDTGIGGETALSIGQALQEVSLSSQVIAITHLPQIANYADRLIVVNKEAQSKRTVSTVKHIEENEREEFIREMIAL